MAKYRPFVLFFQDSEKRLASSTLNIKKNGVLSKFRNLRGVDG